MEGDGTPYHGVARDLGIHPVLRVHMGRVHAAVHRVLGRCQAAEVPHAARLRCELMGPVAADRRVCLHRLFGRLIPVPCVRPRRASSSHTLALA